MQRGSPQVSLRTTRTIHVLSGVIAVFATLNTAHAEPVLVSIEGQGALALTAPQSDLFGPGANLALAVRYPLAASLQIGVEMRGGLLSGGSPPADVGIEDPGAGSFELGMMTLRLRPFAGVDGSGPRRAVGFFVDGGGGGGVTGELKRFGFQGGLGYGFSLGGGFALAPTLRYLQIVQPADALASDDARLLMLGVELSAFDAPARVHRKPPPPKAKVEPADTDHDGIDDEHDRCVDKPEDKDGHEDSDGCPDPDNDHDGVLDVKDSCPNEAEDPDKFEDSDGCPDPDNDRDQFLDPDDKCPLEAEVINGNEDYDGCPDEGLIVLENDRIVLEERVLFDFERARVKNAAQPVLHAIVKLRQQHPEWIEVRVEGHADAKGTAELNQRLSERRAKNVMKALIEQGIPASLIQSVGYGSSQPRDSGTSEEANQRNRRVEFVVVARNPVAPEEPEPAAPKAEPKGAKPGDVKPLEVKPAEAKPGDAKTPGVKPADVKPIDVKPAEAKAPGVKPADVKPAEGKPGDGKAPAAKPEVKAAEAKPTPEKPVAQPAETKPAAAHAAPPSKPAPKPPAAGAAAPASGSSLKPVGSSLAPAQAHPKPAEAKP